MKKVVVLSGAGISAESGISTFRDADGLWEGHDVMEVASPQGWNNNPLLVLNFYNERRKQLKEVSPNKAHLAIAELENHFQVSIVTQNVDDLHERAGSSMVVHLHGELLKARSTFDENLVYDWHRDIKIGDFCELQHQLRPHIVWFGEMVPLIEHAASLVEQADYIMVVGTSMQVYPAASLVHYRKASVPVYFVDPKPSITENEMSNLTIIPEKATTGITKAISLLTDK
ncbi:SIR2 family NAD-dependent protein deacylase [Ascidiimonas sp. W6]|uniref:SIR2 family NAD-dependent protein deacylase n=1 Tax=Ascidiimonas meishanensis TaxID=3128903 RepID=UPI0030EE9321